MPIERKNAVTFKGNPLTLLGPELKTGDSAPNFEVLDRSLNSVSLEDTKGKAKIFSVVPSLDTPVCDTQTRRFNEEATRIPGVQVYTVSMDLPFAQSRWCSATGVSKVTMLSDHLKGSFGENWGTLVKELRLDARAVFVVDQDGVIQHAEYVGEIADHPDYEAALSAARSVVE